MAIAFQSSPDEALSKSERLSLLSRISMLARVRYQLLGALILSVIIPALIPIGFNLGYRPGLGSTELTLMGTLGAMLAGFFLLRRMTSYPGVQALSFVLTAFVCSFLLTILIFFFARIDYSRLQFFASFALVVAWFFLTTTLDVRVRRPRLLVLPYGDAVRIVDMPGADWVLVPSSIQLALPMDGALPQAAAPRPEWLEAALQVGLAPGISGVVADLRADLPSAMESFIADCALKGIPVYHSKQLRESLGGRVEIEHLSENTLGSLLPSSLYFPVKRTVDLTLAAILLLPILVIGLGAAIAIKLEDGGKIFFRQRRIGYRGVPFTIVKFRTMREGADSGDLFTTEGDDRITRIGRSLRRCRIDELPQVINILRGEMSWIGPRPESEPLSRWYDTKIPFYVYRHIVPPGISGWAQVNQGNVAQLPAATGKLHYDFFYIKNFSPWLDLLIAIRTIGTVLTGFGSR